MKMIDIIEGNDGTEELEEGGDKTRQEKRGEDYNLPLVGSKNFSPRAVSEGQTTQKQSILIHLLQLRGGAFGLGEIGLLSGARCHGNAVVVL